MLEIKIKRNGRLIEITDGEIWVVEDNLQDAITLYDRRLEVEKRSKNSLLFNKD